MSDEPRYVVTALRGRLRVWSGHHSSTPGLSVHVHDRLKCWRVVAVYRIEDLRGSTLTRSQREHRVRRLARARAAELNALEAADLAAA